MQVGIDLGSIVPGASHDVVTSQPAAVNALILKYLEEPTPPWG